MPLNELRLSVSGIEYVFYAADAESGFFVDAERMVSLLEALAQSIPEEYRRRHIETIVIILSSRPYCIHYDDWTREQKRALREPLDSYFTSEKGERNVLGACTSFPGTQEKERVVWLATGTLGNDPMAQKEAIHCAYSYHLYGPEGLLFLSRLLHEVTHALSITVTMPALEDYGFTHNIAWEKQQRTRGAMPELLSVEALAFDMTKKALETFQPGFIFQIVPLTVEEEAAPLPPEEGD